MDRVLLKEKAKKAISAYKTEAVVVALVMGMCEAGGTGVVFNFFPRSTTIGQEYALDESILPMMSGILASVFIVSFIYSAAKYFIFNILGTGGCRFFLKLSKNERTGVGEITGNFRDGNYMNIALTLFVKDICTTLWSLLFIIPGIIKYYEYSMIPFILAVRPDIDRKEAFSISKTLMEGHKFDYFVLLLSFYGWLLLSAFTCGILAVVYVNPYIQAAKAEFFYEVREDAILRGDLLEFMLPSYGAANNGFNGDNGFNDIPPTDF